MKKRYVAFIIMVISLVMVVMVYGREKGSIALSTTFRQAVSDDKNETIEENDIESTENQVSEESQKIEGLDFIVATDIHYLASSLTDKGVAFQKYTNSGDGRQLIYIEEIVEALKFNVIEKQPEVLIISGDLTNNGEKASHEELALKFSEIEKGGTEVLVVPGNHDVNNPWARAFEGEKQVVTESVTAQDFESIYSDFGFNQAISRDKASLSYLVEANEEVWVLMLDTAMYDNNTSSPVTSGRLRTSTLEWIESCSELAEENGVQIVTAMHHNLYIHSDLLNDGFTINESEKVYETFKEAGLNFVLTGHIHIQDIKVDQENKVYDIVTNALIVNPHLYGKITYDKDNGFVYSTESVDVEKWAKENGVEDENLLNFSSYASKYFYDKSYNQTYNRLVDNEEYTAEESKAMASVMAELNVNYFGGTVNQIAEDVKASEGYKLWTSDANESFTKYYIQSMVDVTEDYNYVEIPNQVR